jgi:hypothetical protein
MSVARKGVWTGFAAVGACALLLSLMLPIAPGVANAASELDQKQETGEGLAPVDESHSLAQTFMAGKSGTLEKVELLLGTRGTPTQALNVEITEVNASGEPDTTKVLGSASFGPTALSAEEWVPFNVAAPSKAGTEYAIVAFSGTPASQLYFWPNDEFNPYAGGEAFSSGESPPATWLRDSTLDQTFRTYVAAATLPTSIEQCKKGGWKNFGTMFKNQGQYVKFVETGR